MQLMQLGCRFCDHKQSCSSSCFFFFFPSCMHSCTYILHRCLLPCFISLEVSLVPVTRHPHLSYPYFPCCSLFKLSSPGWPACQQRCSCPIWSSRSTSPQQSLIFKEGPVAVKASFLPTPPALAGSLHGHVNLFSIFPSAAQVGPLLLQAGHRIPLPCPSPSPTS